jgi:hypothetical protein
VQERGFSTAAVFRSPFMGFAGVFNASLPKLCPINTNLNTNEARK